MENLANTFDELTLTYVLGYSRSQHHGGTHPDGFKKGPEIELQELA